MRPTREELLLPDHHRRIERLLEGMKIECRKGDPRALCAQWTDFEGDLNDHMAAEEEFLLPPFGEQHPDEAAFIGEDHARIRELLSELGLQVDLHCVRAEGIDQMVERLREHARREDALLYPWAAENLASWRGALRRIHEKAHPLPAELRTLLDDVRLKVHLAGMDAAVQLEAIQRDAEKLRRAAVAAPQRTVDVLLERLRALRDALDSGHGRAEAPAP
jgi:hypothetical protein